MTTTIPTEYQLLNRIQTLIDALCQNYLKDRDPEDIEKLRKQIAFEIIPGKKYYKIIMINWGSRSVHAFVDKEGSVYKPASWRGPAKHVRYNLLDEASYKNCLERADWAGGYLYI